jgi:hypothetical protein
MNLPEAFDFTEENLSEGIEKRINMACADRYLREVQAGPVEKINADKEIAGYKDP